jgi:hypothetical protein
MSATIPAVGRRRRAAAVITEVLSPIYLVAGLLLLVAWHSAPTRGQAVAVGIVSAVFASLIPFAVLLHGIRRGHLADRHLRPREQRPVMMVISLASVLTGLLLLAVWGAPRELLALVAAMVVGLVSTLVVTLWWKISIHSAVAAGTAVILLLVFGPPLLAVAPVVGMIGWSRVALGDHTAPQVTAGATLGAVIAATVFSLLR